MNVNKIIQEMIKFDYHTGVRSASKVLESMWNDVEKQLTHRSMGLETGFAELDALLGGLHGGDLIVLAGRPGSGKSIFVQSIIRNMCVKSTNVALFSLEAKAESVMRGIVAGLAKIDINKLWEANFDRDVGGKLSMESEIVNEFPLWIDDTIPLSLKCFIEKVYHIKHTQNIQLIIIDYLQLMAYTHPGTNPDQRIAKLTSAVKKLARILDIPIFLVSQLPRKPKMKHGGNSILSDLYDSVVIESYADVLLFLHNREYHMNDRQRGKAEIIVAKHRNRHIKEHVYLTFYGRQHRFANLLESNNCDVEDECVPW